MIISLMNKIFYLLGFHVFVYTINIVLSNRKLTIRVVLTRK